MGRRIVIFSISPVQVAPLAGSANLAGNIEQTLDRTAALPSAVYVHRASRNRESDLCCGFTAVRDAAGLDRRFRNAVDQGLIQGPRLFLSVTP